MHGQNSSLMAVCVIGGLKSEAAESASKNLASVGRVLLDGRDHHVFAVLHAPHYKNHSLLAQKLNVTFAGHLRALRVMTKMDLAEQQDFRSSTCWQRHGPSKWKPRTNDSPAAMVEAHLAQAMQRKMCAELVKNEQAQSGIQYTAFARLRSYHEFFARLEGVPISIAPRSAYIPEGEDWGASQDVGVSDVMLVGGAAAFEADATLMHSFVSCQECCPPGWIAETATRDSLNKSGIRISRIPLAYCSISKPKGFCLKLGELGRALQPSSVSKVQAIRLCANPSLRARHNCSRWRVAQTYDDFVSDPGFCKLQRQCEAFVGAWKEHLPSNLSTTTTTA